MSKLTRGKPRKDKRLPNLAKMVTEGNKFIKFSMNIPRDIHREFLIKTTIDGKDMKDILMQAIHKYLKNK